MSEKAKPKQEEKSAPTYLFASVLLVCALFTALIFSTFSVGSQVPYQLTASAIAGTNNSRSTEISDQQTQAAESATATQTLSNTDATQAAGASPTGIRDTDSPPTQTRDYDI